MAIPRRVSETRPHEQPATVEPEKAAPPQQSPSPGAGRRVLRTLGLGLITGAADDDPSAIGTYASAGAAIGPAFLWTAPVTFPMMCAVVYLSAKLGQVAGKGLGLYLGGEAPGDFLKHTERFSARLLILRRWCGSEHL